jgi:hypothetical protein
MAITPTALLSLPLITTGTESGSWGEVVDNGLTSYLDIAIAGGLAVSITTANVTLTNTAGTSSATAIGSTTAQYAVLNVSGAMTAARSLILPSSSKTYVINNTCTGSFLLTVKGAATTGVTLQNGETAHVAWNGSDYVKVSGFTKTNNVSYTDYLNETSTTLANKPTLMFQRTGTQTNGTGNVGYTSFTTNGPGSIGTYEAGKIDVTYVNGAGTIGVGKMVLASGTSLGTYPTRIELDNTSNSGYVNIFAGTGISINTGIGTPISVAEDNLLVGTAVAGAGVGVASKIAIQSDGSTYAAVIRSITVGNASVTSWNSTTTGDAVFHDFGTQGPGSYASRGSIDYNRAGGLVRYNTTSDATLKNVIGNAPKAKSLEILDSTVLREYSWKEDATNKAQIGVIAQELYSTFPGAVSVGGDYEVEIKAVLDREGNVVTPAITVTKYRSWGVDKTAFTFHLIAGYQAQKAQIAALEARLTALEAK